MIDSQQIEKLLNLGSLDSAEACQRARILAADIEQIGFETLRLSCRTYPFPSGGGEVIPIQLPEYHFGDTGFSVQNACNSDDDFSTWIGGTGLDRGHLQFFSKVSQVGHRLIPQFWPKKLRAELRNPSQHLDTLEEVWWLGCWSGMQDIRRGERMRSDSADNIDWQFIIGKTGFSSGLKVNLEIKRLKSDGKRHARGGPMSSNQFAQFCHEQVLRKFRASAANEVNVLAISLFGEIDRNVQDVISEWLLSKENSASQHEPLIDAVILATRESRRRSSSDMQLRSEKAKLIKPYFRGPDEEDKSLVFVLESAIPLAQAATSGIPRIASPPPLV